MQCPGTIKHFNSTPARLQIDEEMLRSPNEDNMSNTELNTANGKFVETKVQSI